MPEVAGLVYLKSLNIRGFKSFADKVSLELEPGVMAIVGPNGSGKSNISDAILWVLGERNARHLRGQAMEDVIFAGSASRRAAGLAEVELILDNGDGVLPVDYAEVSIARRIYRSGESEYLINGSAVRRRDVQDLLHDCGLGGSTHSIISQGSLEEILQSSPAERQAMVEEAAGILKHKQRRERASRKLETIGHHLDRVRDIAALLQSQLKPLVRKASRARSHEEIRRRFDEVRLAIAVDDLRGLQHRFEELEDQERTLRRLLSEQREAIDAADETMERLQRRMRRNESDSAERARRVRRLVSAGKSLSGVLLVVKDRCNQHRGAIEAERKRAESLVDERRRRARRLVDAQADLRNLESEHDAAKRALDAARAAQDAIREKLTAHERKARQLRQELGEREAERARTRQTISDADERLGEARLRIEFIEGQDDDLRRSLDHALAESEDLAAQVREGTADLQALIEEEAALSAAIETAMGDRGDLRRELGEAERAVASLKTQREIVIQRERAWLSDRGEARQWLESQRSALDGHLVPLSEALNVDEGYESIVERLLGAASAAVLVDDLDDVTGIADKLQEQRYDGVVQLVARADAAPLPAQSPETFDFLIDHVHASPGDEAALAALLGDVVLCTDLNEAIRRHEQATRPLRFVTADGVIVGPSATVSLGSDPARKTASPLADSRERRRLEQALVESQRVVDEATAALSACEERIRARERERDALNERLADRRGRVRAAQSQAESAQAALNKLRGQLDDLQAQKADALAVIERMRPAIDEASAATGRITAAIEELKTAIESEEIALAPLREESATVGERLSREAVKSATLTERENHLTRAVRGAERSLAEIDAEAETLAVGIERDQAEATVLEALAERFDLLQQRALARGDALEAQDLSNLESSSGLHDEWERARSRSHDLHDAFDQTNGRISDVRVEKSRLEAQVQSIVDEIVGDLGCPLEEAVGLPELQMREQAIEERDHLRERLRRLGTINPDAVREYDELNERYTYVKGQLDDLEAADGALRSITEVIDRRMALDFERTFEVVRENFLTIFTRLFPGGAAELRLIDPEEADEGGAPGIEVSAQPRGKRITKMTLMSGGEKSLTALALLFAIYQVRSAPFYLLDEVEAALDDTNLRRLLAFLDSVSASTQLLVITHQRSTMEMADVLFGVTMQSDGVTQVVSQRLERRGA